MSSASKDAAKAQATKSSAASSSEATASFEWNLLDITTVKPFLRKLSREERKKIIDSMKTTCGSEGFPSDSTKDLVKMSFVEELICCLFFLFVVPGAPFLCMLVLLLLCFFGTAWHITAFFGFVLVQALIPVSFWPDVLNTRFSTMFIKYFHFRGIWYRDGDLDPEKTYIMVAPPHGAFPFANLCTMLVNPRLMGINMRGLAASAVFLVPFFRQALAWIGAVSADRRVATKWLNQGVTIGVSSGGIAEIFETSNEHETIILRNRIGLAKLALRTGAALVPCYCFGNSGALSVWHDKYGYMRWASRKLKVAIFFFWGRFFLPIPYRVPIMGVLGRAIPVEKNENFTDAEAQALLDKLIEEMKILFDTHKAAYGWAHKELIIK